MAAKQSTYKLRLDLSDFDKDEAIELAVYLIDRGGGELHRLEVEAGKEAALPATAVKHSARLLIGPRVDELTARAREQMLALHVRDVLVEGRLNTIVLRPPDWQRLPFWFRCVSGSVEKCPIWLLRNQLSIDRSLSKSQLLASRLSTEPEVFEAVRRESLELARPISAILPWWRCYPICDGTVTVYHRYCCCRPWIIDDPRLDELLRRLRQIVAIPRPPIPFPPDPGPPWHAPIGPGPDPGPEVAFAGGSPLIRGGTVDEAVLNGEADLRALECIESTLIPPYVNDRPYLRLLYCTCGTPSEVAEGAIRPDGTFSICWPAPRIIVDFCTDEYAFVVRQNINGQTVVIYDGVAAGRWFSQTSGITLESFDWRALSCRQDEGPQEDGAFALLQDIGGTASYNLKTPDATGAFSVGAPAYNDGLAYPVATQANAAGNSGNSNWGGTLALRYMFSEGMQAVGARYYRISVCPADGTGAPVGTRAALRDGLAWLWYEDAGATINVRSQSLGPTTVGIEDDLYLIPFDIDRDWQSGQFHGYLNTTSYQEGRYLLTVEVFDGTGVPLRPQGSAGPGNAVGFTFRRWFQALGATADVPFAALTHMLWWDNRPPVAQIVDLRVDGLPSTDECQFRTGPASAQFGAGYRAYHPQPMFILDHSLYWRRGLGGPTGGRQVFTENAGKPPGAVAIYANGTLDDMLPNTPPRRCTFALNLHVDVKTTSGWGPLVSLERDDQASFALEVI